LRSCGFLNAGERQLPAVLMFNNVSIRSRKNFFISDVKKHLPYVEFVCYSSSPSRNEKNKTSQRRLDLVFDSPD